MGYDNFAAWGEEVTWGTAAARSQFARVYEDSKPAMNVPRNPFEFVGERDPEGYFDGIKKGEMSLVLPLVYDGIGLLLTHSLGIAATSGAGPYDHVHSLDDLPFTRASSPLVGLTCEIHAGLPDASFESWLLKGGRVRNASFGFTAGEEVKATFDLVGKECVQAAKSGSPTYPDYDHSSASPLVIPSQVTVEIDDTATEVFSAEASLNNNLRDDKAFLGSEYIAAPSPRGRREITGSLSKEWEDKTLYDAFVAGTPAKLEIVCTGPGNLAMVFLFPAIRFNAEIPDLAATEEVDQSLPFIAYHDDTNGAFEITETNDTA